MEKEAATYFLCGLYGDTGGFRYPNTSPEDLHLAGSLLSAGAEHQRIIETLYFSRSMAFLKLQAYAIDHLTVIGKHELAYFVIREELLDELQADPSDADDLLDNIRVLREIPAYCKIQETGPDTVRFSLRSRDRRYPVLPVARELGGGGHLLAAGARMTGVSLEQAEAALLNAWRKVFHGD
ncbi:MAG: hypothetical protein D6820_08690 [Lentisphaerae bacterium]|nr:MAG: hypothetical protein D6820_08690 [Lentisphaerota bacterium]